MSAPYYEDDTVTLLLGGARDVLRGMSDGSVDCVVTSPPYFGLRDYGVAGQIGLEATPAAFVEALREVFTEVRRVLADYGTCWVNIGDSYASSRRGPDGSSSGLTNGAQVRVEGAPRRFGVPHKNLLGVPWRLAFALQDDGWWLRNAVVWAKPNAMPDSAKDRLADTYELVFLFTKQPRYWFDLDSIRELHVVKDRRPRPLGSTNVDPYHAAATDNVGWKDHEVANHPAGRNPGDVWTIATRPYPGAHYATFPVDLPLRCIAPGCAGEVCTVCGVPRSRITETDQQSTGRSTNGPRSVDRRHREYGTPGYVTRTVAVHRTVGWTDCGHDAYRPGVVLDPFSGTGTTGLAARMLGRRYIGVDIDAASHDQARERFAQGVLTGGAA